MVSGFVRSANQALSVLRKGLMRLGGGAVIDLDIKGFFDNLDHRILRTFLDQRVQRRSAYGSRSTSGSKRAFSMTGR